MAKLLAGLPAALLEKKGKKTRSLYIFIRAIIVMAAEMVESFYGDLTSIKR